MSVELPSAAAFSSAQRRCHILLMLGLSDPNLSLRTVSEINGTSAPATAEDIAELAQQVQRNYQLNIVCDRQGALSLSGSLLGQHLCLIHALRRALLLSADFVAHHFLAVVKRQLREQRISRALYDGRNLETLVQHCARWLKRNFSERDRLLLQIYYQLTLTGQAPPNFSTQQTDWLRSKREHRLACHIVRCWQKRHQSILSGNEALMLTLLLSQLHIPVATRPADAHELRLFVAVQQLILHFQQLSRQPFARLSGLRQRLIAHLAQAVERARFNIGIDPLLVDDVAQNHPKLLRLTQVALSAFEATFGIRFSREERVLVAIIFAAWRMQESAAGEKQVLLLTGYDAPLEQRIERTLRRLTLVPLNVRYLPVKAYQQTGAPQGTTLVVTPCVTSLPLFSPPLFHIKPSLNSHQRNSLRALLES